MIGLVIEKSISLKGDCLLPNGGHLLKNSQIKMFYAKEFKLIVGLLMLPRFMKPLLLVSACIAALSTATVAQCNIKLRINAKVPVKCLPRKDEETKYVATHPSQFRPSIERTVAGVKYTIAFDEETLRIKYIHTSDRAFRAANGLRVGSQLKVTLNQIAGGDGGWYMFAGRTPDGWDIIIADEPLNNWKENEIRTVFVGAFKKGGN